MRAVWVESWGDIYKLKEGWEIGMSVACTQGHGGQKQNMIMHLIAGCLNLGCCVWLPLQGTGMMTISLYVYPLVLESPVQSAFLAPKNKTKTETSPDIS